MNTPTHFLMTASLRKACPRLRMVRSAVLLGSVAPDLPLYLLSIGGLLYFRYVVDWPLADAAKHIFGSLYFYDPAWIGLHNVLHSPLSLLMLLAAVRRLLPRPSHKQNWANWFLLACLLHSAVDIVTHHDDGPLLFWPLDWQWRYQSPISYWDHRHFGTEVARFEMLLVGCMLVYLAGPWLYRHTLGRVIRFVLGADDK